MPDLSVIIPARCEQFLAQTVSDVLANLRGDTEVIAVVDGYQPDPPLAEHSRLLVLNLPKPVGQRAATNAGARASKARWIMKLDAHCAVDEGFDTKLIRDWQPGYTLIPSMYNLHAFDWVCRECCEHTYQGSPPAKCGQCGGQGFEQHLVWMPRPKHLTISWRFDSDLQFQYWPEYAQRPECQGEILDTMSFLGACMFLERERFWALGGMDEAHGSWGQFGTEWACKTWLSGGRLATTKRTWFAHLFRTANFAGNGTSPWPYPITQAAIDGARAYSRDLWLNDRWPLAKHKLAWLIERFAPVPGWH